jgi:two-component system chemotaxis response regulator CheB
LLIDDGFVRLVRGPRQNRHRPSIDPLLRSAARWSGPNAVAVILSGAAGDAVSGSLVIAARRGLVIVQHPDEALFPGMPAKVLEAVPAARRMRIRDIAGAVTAAVRERAEIPVVPGLPTGGGQELDTMDEVSTAPLADTGLPAYSCPDCGGVLEEVEDGGQLRFRCRVGHSFYGEELATAQWTELESALWAAVRGMEETGELAGRLARMADERGASLSAARHRGRAEDVLAQAGLIRDFLLSPRAEREEDEGPPRAAEMAAAGE